jgi:ABC-2 type transport system ATP-binding protein
MAEAVRQEEAEAVARPDRRRDNLTIQVRGISKSFGQTKAVDTLSFDVRRGEVVGFLGPNGSGKTTTMRMLTSFYTPDEGDILIDGVDSQEQDMVTRQRIGYLPENNPLYGELLVSEYLRFVADLRRMSPAERRENLDRTVTEAGLSEVYNRPISQLSKGYRQRVGLAQAILHQPAVLVLDEPTEGLDPNQRMTIRELVGSLGQDKTVLLSTHVMQEVEATCERVLVINRGRLIADSTVAELMKRARGLQAVYVVEVEGSEVESGLNSLPNVDSVERLDPVDGRKRYQVSPSGDDDPRPEIFGLAKRRDWVLWELHEERARLEDVFHALTAGRQPEGQ